MLDVLSASAAPDDGIRGGPGSLLGMAGHAGRVRPTAVAVADDNSNEPLDGPCSLPGGPLPLAASAAGDDQALPLGDTALDLYGHAPAGRGHAANRFEPALPTSKMTAGLPRTAAASACLPRMVADTSGETCIFIDALVAGDGGAFQQPPQRQHPQLSAPVSVGGSSTGAAAGASRKPKGRATGACCACCAGNACGPH